jgi:uncharacterized protein YxeA
MKATVKLTIITKNMLQPIIIIIIVIIIIIIIIMYFTYKEVSLSRCRETIFATSHKKEKIRGTTEVNRDGN